MGSFTRNKSVRTGGIRVVKETLACSADKGDAADFPTRRFEKRRTHRRTAKDLFQDCGKLLRCERFGQRTDAAALSVFAAKRHYLGKPQQLRRRIIDAAYGRIESGMIGKHGDILLH